MKPKALYLLSLALFMQTGFAFSAAAENTIQFHPASENIPWAHLRLQISGTPGDPEKWQYVRFLSHSDSLPEKTNLKNTVAGTFRVLCLWGPDYIHSDHCQIILFPGTPLDRADVEVKFSTAVDAVNNGAPKELEYRRVPPTNINWRNLVLEIPGFLPREPKADPNTPRKETASYQELARLISSAPEGVCWECDSQVIFGSYAMTCPREGKSVDCTIYLSDASTKVPAR